MSSEPVTVWVSTDDNGRSLLRLSEPENVGGDMALVLHNSHVPPGECREFVLIPADQYRHPTAELSPVAKLIASISATLAISPREHLPQLECINRAVQIVTLAIAAAREIKIESEVK